MPLLKNDRIIEDDWTFAADDVSLPSNGKIVVSLQRWLDDYGSILDAPFQAVGVRLKSDQSPAQVVEYLDHIDLIELDFPAFTDGRSYSSARLLRDRYGYRGEVRAVGHALRDQYAFMLRCGIDTVQIREGEDVSGWLEAAGSMSEHYQPSADGVRTVWQKRHVAA